MGRCRRRRSLEMNRYGVGCLRGQARFAPVPHDRGQEWQVGAGQRTAINRDDPLARLRGTEARQPGCRVRVAAVGVLDGDDAELQRRRARQGQPDPDQALGQDQRVGTDGAQRRRYVGTRANRAVNEPEQRRGSEALQECGLDLRRRDGPRRGGLVTCLAGPAVGSERLEEGVARGRRRACGLKRRQKSARVQEARNLRDHRRRLLDGWRSWPADLERLPYCPQRPERLTGCRERHVARGGRRRLGEQAARQHTAHAEGQKRAPRDSSPRSRGHPAARRECRQSVHFGCVRFVHG